MKDVAHLKSQLVAGITSLQIDANEEQIEKLLHYLSLLDKWNKVYNLTAIRNPEEMLVKHLLDSLAIVSHIEGDNIIDVGTGGGLPGIPLAIMFPEKQVTLLDSNSKKTRFLVQAKAELDLVNVRVVHSRVEEHQPEQGYDAVVSRAFASLQDMLHWTQHLTNENGAWWAMKAQKEFEDLAELPKMFKVELIVDLHVPGLDADRILIKVVKS